MPNLMDCSCVSSSHGETSTSATSWIPNNGCHLRTWKSSSGIHWNQRRWLLERMVITISYHLTDSAFYIEALVLIQLLCLLQLCCDMLLLRVGCVLLTSVFRSRRLLFLCVWMFYFLRLGLFNSILHYYLLLIKYNTLGNSV